MRSCELYTQREIILSAAQHQADQPDREMFEFEALVFSSTAFVIEEKKETANRVTSCYDVAARRILSGEAR